MPKQSTMPKGCPEFEPYTNGKTWEWKRGEDFRCLPDTIRRYAYQWGGQNGYRTHAKIEGDSVFIRFTKRTQHEED